MDELIATEWGERPLYSGKKTWVDKRREVDELIATELGERPLYSGKKNVGRKKKGGG